MIGAVSAYSDHSRVEHAGDVRPADHCYITSHNALANQQHHVIVKAVHGDVLSIIHLSGPSDAAKTVRSLGLDSPQDSLHLDSSPDSLHLDSLHEDKRNTATGMSVRRGSYSLSGLHSLGRAVHRVDHSRATNGMLPPQVTIQLAEECSRLQSHKYDLLSYNCEHIATFCKTGIAESNQVLFTAFHLCGSVPLTVTAIGVLASLYTDNSSFVLLSLAVHVFYTMVGLGGVALSCVPKKILVVSAAGMAMATRVRSVCLMMASVCLLFGYLAASLSGTELWGTLRLPVRVRQVSPGWWAISCRYPCGARVTRLVRARPGRDGDGRAPVSMAKRLVGGAMVVGGLVWMTCTLYREWEVAENG